MKHESTNGNIRKLTVCNKGFSRQRGRDHVLFPVIHLTGKWLWEKGFRGGHVIKVSCEDKKLIITLAEEQRFENL